MGSNAGTRHPRRSQDLPPGPPAAGEARRFLREALGDQLSPEQVQLAALLTTEIVSIAVRHRLYELAKPLKVTVSVDDNELLVVIRDQEWGFNIGQESEARDDIWGLMLVAKLSSRWGVERSAGGTYVWFEL